MMMCLWASYTKKYENKYFFAFLKSMKKGVDLDPLVIGSDPPVWFTSSSFWGEVPSGSTFITKSSCDRSIAAYPLPSFLFAERKESSEAVLRIRICRIRMFLDLLDPDPDPSITKQK